MMRRLKTFGHQRSAVALAVLMAHVAVVWLFWLAGQARIHFDTPGLSDLIYIMKVEVPPRQITPGNPDPVEFRLLPQTSPQPQMPRPSVIPVDTFDSPQPGPDPAPSTVVAITSPGPVNAGQGGFPGVGETRGLRFSSVSFPSIRRKPDVVARKAPPSCWCMSMPRVGLAK